MKRQAFALILSTLAMAPVQGVQVDNQIGKRKEQKVNNQSTIAVIPNQNKTQPLSNSIKSEVTSLNLLTFQEIYNPFKEVQEKLSKSKKQLELETKIITTQKEEIEKLKNQLANLTGQRDELTLQKNKPENTEKVIEFTTAILEVINQKKPIKDTLEQKTKLYNQKNEEIINLKNQINDFEGNSNTIKDTIKKEIKELETTIKDIAKQIQLNNQTIQSTASGDEIEKTLKEKESLISEKETAEKNLKTLKDVQAKLVIKEERTKQGCTETWFNTQQKLSKITGFFSLFSSEKTKEENNSNKAESKEEKIKTDKDESEEETENNNNKKEKKWSDLFKERSSEASNDNKK